MCGVSGRCPSRSLRATGTVESAKSAHVERAKERHTKPPIVGRRHKKGQLAPGGMVELPDKLRRKRGDPHRAFVVCVSRCLLGLCQRPDRESVQV